MDSTRPSKAWDAARAQLRQLESSAARMSSSWFLGNGAIIASAALLLVTAMVLAASASNVLDQNAAAQRAQTILLETAALQEALDDSGTAIRGYLLSHDPELLARRSEAQRAANDHLGRLRVAVDRDGAAVSGEFGRLADLIGRRAHSFDRLLDPQAKPSQSDEIERIDIVRRSIASISELRNRATADLRVRQRRTATDLRLAMWLALFAAVAAPVFGLVGVHLLRRERDSHRARELQMELMHVQRLAIMGETSAMLAHEINQPLTAAANYLSVVRRHLDNGAADKAGPIVERIGQQIQRASMILKKLRRFIEKRESERDLEAPDVLVEDALTLLGTIDSTVAIETCIDPGLPYVLVDRVQLQQVLVNLMRNAIEAMQQMPVRELRLAVSARGHNAIEVSLFDTGPGLAPDVADRLFQPFVSTKEGGMGVGLSICRSIIEQHGGRIWAEPNLGGGTVFRFTLPAVREQVAVHS